MSALNIPPPSAEDRLPDEKAVWREGRPAETEPASRAICVDYGGGVIARTHVKSVPDWGKVERWRFGWAAA